MKLQRLPRTPGRQCSRQCLRDPRLSPAPRFPLSLFQATFLIVEDDDGLCPLASHITIRYLGQFWVFAVSRTIWFIGDGSEGWMKQLEARLVHLVKKERRGFWCGKGKASWKVWKQGIICLSRLLVQEWNMM